MQSHADSMVKRASDCIARHIVLQLCLYITVRFIVGQNYKKQKSCDNYPNHIQKSISLDKSIELKYHPRPTMGEPAYYINNMIMTLTIMSIPRDSNQLELPEEWPKIYNKL